MKAIGILILCGCMFAALFTQCRKKATTAESKPPLDTLNIEFYPATMRSMPAEQKPELIPFNDRKKWGYADYDGNIRIPCSFKEVNLFLDGLAEVTTEDGRHTVINIRGEELLPGRDSLSNIGSGYYLSQSGDTATVWHSQKQVYTTTEKVSQFSARGKVLCVCVNRHDPATCTFYTKEGKQLKGYTDFTIHTPSLLLASKNGLHWLADENGKLLWKKGYERIQPIYGIDDELYRIWTGSKCGMADASGNEMLPIAYDDFSPIVSSNTCIVKKDGKAGLVDMHNKLLIEPMYHKLSHAWGPYYIASDTVHSSIVTEKNDTVGGFVFTGLWYDDCNLLIGTKDDKSVLVHLQTGTQFEVPEKIDVRKVVKPGLLIVESAGKMGVLNLGFESIIPIEYDDIQYDDNFFYTTQRFYNKKDEKRLFDTDGDEVTDEPYEHIESFSQGLAVVKTSCMSGYINQEGEMVIDTKYHYASAFDAYGFAIVAYNGYFGMIDTKGKEVLPLKYPAINTGYGYYFFNREGYISHKGVKCFNLAYDDNESPTLDKQIADIRASYNTIVKRKSADSMVSVTLSDGQVRLYFHDKKLCLLMGDLQGDTHYECYFNDSLLTNYPFFILKTTNGQSERLYFSAYGILRHLDPKNQALPICPTAYISENPAIIEAINLRNRSLTAIFRKRHPTHNALEKQIDKQYFDCLNKRGTIEDEEDIGDGGSTTIRRSVSDAGELIWEEETYAAEWGTYTAKSYYYKGSLIYCQEEGTTSNLLESLDGCGYEFLTKDYYIKTYYHNGRPFRRYEISDPDVQSKLSANDPPYLMIDYSLETGEASDYGIQCGSMSCTWP